MKIAIVGSREFSCPNFVKEKIDKICEALGHMEKPLTIISGGAKGVDTWAEEVAKTWEGLGVETIIFKPNWNDLSHPDAVIKTGRYGKYDAMAGKRRNTLIINEADSVLAFWDGKSEGTKDSINKAIVAGKPVNIYIRK